MWKKTNNKIDACFKSLNALIQDLFTCFITGDYFERHYFYERQFHSKRKAFLCASAQLRLMNTSESSALLNNLENTYEIILAMGLLLYRVKDHTTFAVASNDFTAISENIALLFQFLSASLFNKKLPTIVDSLAENIQQLEEVNRRAIRLVANDPMVFLLFINDLQALDDILMHLSTDIADFERKQ